MTIRPFTEECGEWLRADAPGRPIVVSSRVRLARNLAGHRFAGRADDAEKRRIVDRVRDAVENSPRGRGLVWFDLDAGDPESAQLLLERHLISRELAEAEGPRAVAVAPDERLAVMVVEEDHIRLQAISAGLRVEETLADAQRLDREISARLEYAYDPRFGYLTACPSNVGTGLRVSVLLHLPALVMTGHSAKAFRAIGELHLAVRGLFGEGTEAMGELFQVSNQRTCGKDEATLARDLAAVVDRIIDYERQARQRLRRRANARLDDRVHRAWAILRHARRMSTKEMLQHLSSVRLGRSLGLLPPVDEAVLDRLFLHGQPAHLQEVGGEKMEADDRDRRRADLIRQTLSTWGEGGGTSQSQ